MSKTNYRTPNSFRRNNKHEIAKHKAYDKIIQYQNINKQEDKWQKKIKMIKKN
jgi:hypothetical protein